jgi:hypothetical protein
MSKKKKAKKVAKKKEKQRFMLTIEHTARHYLYVMAESRAAALFDFNNGVSEDYDFDTDAEDDTLVSISKVKS